MLKDAEFCADLGAGTGNGAISLLNELPSRRVWAFESNENMIERLRSKWDARNSDRLYVIKGDAVLSLREFDADFFDGAIMINSLYPVYDKRAYLREVYRVLKPGGVLVISTPHDKTDVKALFEGIRRDLHSKGLLQELRAHVDDAYQRHLEMDSAIHNDSKKQTYDLITTAGFIIEEVIDPAYIGAVVIIRASKAAS